MSDSLPPYDVWPMCIKCGYRDARTVYYDDGTDEYHERRCRRCGYIWYEAVLNGET